MAEQIPSQRESRFAVVAHAGAFMFVFAAGINSATHHWADAAGEILLASLMLGVRAWIRSAPRVVTEGGS